MYFRLDGVDYFRLNSAENTFQIYKDTSINGNLDVNGQVKSSRQSQDYPLYIYNNYNGSDSWFVGKYESTLNEVGCLFQYTTSASSTTWWQGVWGANTNEFNIWHNYKGLSLKEGGNASISGNLLTLDRRRHKAE